MITKNAVLVLVLWVLQGNAYQLYEEGKEYEYQYLGLFTTGLEEPVPYASAYRLKATLRVQGGRSNTITAKLEDISIALYNGKWSYFPTPDFQYVSDEQLGNLQEPFKIVLTDEGKFKTLIMNDQEPEFASNLKRGLATYLQMNLTSGFDSMGIFNEDELTTMGECPTAYEITPIAASQTGLVRVGKFRNHGDCLDVPKRTRYGNRAFYSCSNDHTRDILNSTSYSVYDISLNGNKPTIYRLTVLASILYWPFTSSGQYLYSWYNLTLALDNVSPIATAIPDPENAENHEDLAFVFEQSDYQDSEEELPDLKTMEPFFFHQTATEPEPDAVETLIVKAKKAVEEVAKSLETKMDTFGYHFHTNAPVTISWTFSFLDYDSVKRLYTEYVEKAGESKRKLTELQLCVDGLMTTGTSATSLVIRDILLESEDSAILARVIPTFPVNLRNPSEALVKEFEPVFELLKGQKFSNSMKRMLEFSLASLVSKGCERNLCASTGILDKYIQYFEDKLSQANNFEEQTSAILGLRNLRIGNSLDKVLEIAVGNKTYSNTVRVQAIWSLRPLFFRNPETMTRTLLQVFFNRTESCEIRTSVFSLIMGTKPEERTLHQIAYFMWSETCPQTLNIVRSTLTVMSKSKGPCTKIGTFAKTILKYLPPGAVDPTRTTAYAIDYYDESFGFGRTYYASVQKSGKAALPVSVYFGSSIHVGGYSSSPTGVFIRMQGLEKFIPATIFQNTPDDASLQKILNVLSELKVQKRVPTPLKLELTLLYLDRVVLYYAADEKTLIPSIVQIAKKVKDLQKFLTFSWEQTLIHGEVLYQQPLEVGVPVSIYTVAATVTLASAKTGMDVKQSYLVETDSELQNNVYVRTTISNHAPFRGIMHRAGLARTLRTRFPRHFAISGKLNQQGKFNFTQYIPPAENPMVIQLHAAAYTLIMSENPTHNEFTGLLKQSCPTCYSGALVKSGNDPKSTEIAKLPTLVKGVQAGVNLFMCQKDVSKAQIVKKLKHLLGDSGKNTGLYDRPLTKIFLGTQHVSDYFYLWPIPDYCGLSIYLSKSANSSERLEKVEGTISTAFGLDQSTVDTNFLYKYEGDSSPTNSVSLHVKINPEKAGSQSIIVKGTLVGDLLNYNGVGCLEIHNQDKIPQTDPLGFNGVNEPSINQTIRIQLGKLPKGDSNFIADPSSAKCANNHADISIIGMAERSQEQVQEVLTNPTNSLSYLFCQLERDSGAWPKNIIPPTKECLEVVLDQTRLRKINFTINYKVAEAVQKRWNLPISFIGNLLSAYAVDPEQDKVHVHNKDHGHGSSPAGSAKYQEGEIEIDMNLRKDGSQMDVHFIGSSDNEEQHFHGVDLSLIPDAFQPQPAPSRFGQLTPFLSKVGFTGSCTVSPQKILTFDNLKYPGLLSECETVVAADCTDHPLFVISAKQSANSKLTVNLLVGEFRLELSEQKATLNENIIVEFDEFGSFAYQIIQLKKVGDDIFVKVIPFGVSLRYANGAFVEVILSSRYRGITCGLCGDFDTTAYNDVKGPTIPNCPQSSMVTAWTIPSGTCKATRNAC